MDYLPLPQFDPPALVAKADPALLKAFDAPAPAVAVVRPFPTTRATPARPAGAASTQLPAAVRTAAPMRIVVPWTARPGGIDCPT